MQDEVNEKVVALSIRMTKQGARLTYKLFVAALKQYLKMQNKVVHRISAKNKKPARGKQSIKKLMAKDLQLTNIEITDQNIKSFERTANKYNIDFSLKKDLTVSPPRYLVFFKARDVDVMNMAFREYTEQYITRPKKHSVLQKLQRMKAKAQDLNQVLEKFRNRARGQER